MNNIRISDMTLRQDCAQNLTFKEKLELCRLLDRLQADVIELPLIENDKADSLFIKTVADIVGESTLSVQCRPDPESIDQAWEALKFASSPRISLGKSYNPVVGILIFFSPVSMPRIIPHFGARGAAST